LACDAIGFYQLDQDQLQLEAQHGFDPGEQEGLQSLPLTWLQEDQDVRAVIDVADSVGLPEGISRSGFGALMGKRVYLPDRMLGILAVFWRSPRRFSVEDIALFGALTDELGVIMENFRLRKTAAEAAMQEERSRLARDLHDSVSQSLHSLVLSAETANQMNHTQPDRLERALAHLVTSARQALKEMRLLLYELRLMLAPEATGLQSALENRLDAVERRAGVEASLVVASDASWPGSWDSELYFLAVEALNNALKHSRASQVTISLRGDLEDFEICVADNGQGFDARENCRQKGGMGLSNMAERAQRLGGRLQIETDPGNGTRVSFLKGAPKAASPPISSVLVQEKQGI
jgi:signal transduction histidine kinase